MRAPEPPSAEDDAAAAAAEMLVATLRSSSGQNVRAAVADPRTRAAERVELQVRSDGRLSVLQSQNLFCGIIVSYSLFNYLFFDRRRVFALRPRLRGPVFFEDVVVAPPRNRFSALTVPPPPPRYDVVL